LFVLRMDDDSPEVRDLVELANAGVDTLSGLLG
jgi:hypothetical protein